MLLSLLFSFAASANGIYDVEGRRALLFYAEGETVKAALCDPMSVEDLYAGRLDTCKDLTPLGLSRTDVVTRFDHFKKQLLESNSPELVEALTPEGLWAQMQALTEGNVLRPLSSERFDREKSNFRALALEPAL